MPVKCALITGSTDGIGKATASKLLQEGWEVVVTGRSPSRCASVVEELKASSGSTRVSGLTADLSSLPAIRQLAEAFRANHSTLDALILNANSITHTHTLTPEGFEANLAVGYVGRILLFRLLEDLLLQTPGSQVLSVVGLNLTPLDFSDPNQTRGFSSGRALGIWQWCMQVFACEYARRGQVALNLFMPGLVKTKILSNEPQPMRLLVQVMNVVMGISVETSAQEVSRALQVVQERSAKGEYISRGVLKPRRTLKLRPGDEARLWDQTEAWLRPWLS